MNENYLLLNEIYMKKKQTTDQKIFEPIEKNSFIYFS